MKYLNQKLIAAAGAVVLLGAIQYAAQADNDDERSEAIEQHRIVVGFKVAPVPLNLAHKNADLVGLGSYLVNGVAGCSDCHTNPTYVTGGDPFKGERKVVNAAHYLAGGGMQFGPIFVPRNLTPENGLPAGHTYAEFRNILRTGIDYDHAHPQFGPLLQVMPWPGFQSMTDHDIRAIYEYLSAIPPAMPETPTTAAAPGSSPPQP